MTINEKFIKTSGEFITIIWEFCMVNPNINFRKKGKGREMRKYTRKLMAAAMCAAMTASMIPASTWAGENTDEMSVIRIMGINNTVTTVNGGTVSLKDWIESGNSQLYNTFTEELAKRNIKLEFNLIEEDQYAGIMTAVASGNLSSSCCM